MNNNTNLNTYDLISQKTIEFDHLIEQARIPLYDIANIFGSLRAMIKSQGDQIYQLVQENKELKKD
jgi:hypothetical protein